MLRHGCSVIAALTPPPLHRKTSVRPRGMVNSISVHTTAKRKMVHIGTHNGTFHCDEALGCFLLQQTDRFRNAEVVRSRDQDTLKDLDIVIDVGGVYDPSRSAPSESVLRAVMYLCMLESIYDT